MYIEEPLHTYLDDLASAQSTPGGGSAAALCGAMAASLVSMVARLTIGKAEYAAVEPEIADILEQTEQLRTRFQHLMQEDIEAYGRLSACFKLPRATDEERKARTQAIQGRLVEAALVPLTVMECAAQLVTYCRRIAEIGNKNVLSDVATGAMVATSAGSGAFWMVRTNLRAMKDVEQVEALSLRANTALEHITATSQQVTAIVGARA